MSRSVCVPSRRGVARACPVPAYRPRDTPVVFPTRKKQLLSIDEGGGDVVFGLTQQPDETTTTVR